MTLIAAAFDIVAVAAILGLGLTVLAAIALGCLTALDTLRARRRAREAHRRADVWLDPRSLSYSCREPRP